MFETSDIILVLVSFFVGLVSTALGTSCGVNFAVMATVLPPVAVVPLHGLLEGISSGIRCTLMRKHVNYKFVLLFTAGGIVGMVSGWPLIGRYSDDNLRLILGTFFLLTIWVPLAWMRLAPTVGGAMTSCLSVLVGATGPLVAALIARRERDHRVVIGTQGACTVFQHWGKVLLFTIAGFSFANYAELIVALSAATLLGTWLGKGLLLKLPQRLLRLALKAVVSILGLQLLLDGLNIELGSVAVGSSSGAMVILALLMLGSYISYQIGVSTTRDGALQRTGALVNAPISTHLMAGTANSRVSSQTASMSCVSNSNRLQPLFITKRAIVSLVLAIGMLQLPRSQGVRYETFKLTTALDPTMEVSMATTAAYEVKATALSVQGFNNASEQPDHIRSSDASTDNAYSRDDIDTLLIRTHADIEAMRLTLPPGNNAWERFNAVLALNPDNTSARQGLHRIVSRYIELAKNADAMGSPRSAAIYLTRARTVLFGSLER